MSKVIKYLRKVIPHNSPIRLLYTRALQVCAYILLPVDTSKLKLIGITGTDGKTTTVEMAAHILGELDIKYLSTSSLESKLNGKVLSASKRTTPSLWVLRKLLRQAVANNTEVVVIEVSSHALVQWRVLGIKFDAAVLTNITHEHLNYHKTIESYAAAKKLLFTKHLKTGGVTILPTNDNYGSEWLSEFKSLAQSYTPPDAATNKLGTTFDYKNEQYSVPILGDYNTGNALAAALAINSASTTDTDKALRTLSNFAGIPGRMQVVQTPRSGFDATVIVDFALTERAMHSTLATARDIAGGNKVIVVFGATGGQHDTTVRPGLARSAALGANICIVTDDEPYYSDPAEIRADLIKYITETNEQNEKLRNLASKFENIAGRREAIRTSLSLATDGDVVIVTGMGHYTSRTVKGREESWNDVEVIQEELAALTR